MINVITVKNTDEQEQFAVKEFQFFIKEILGEDCSVFTEEVKGLKGINVYLGKTEKAKSLIKTEDLELDGYTVKVSDNDVIICGGAGQGTIFGVYGFFKEFFNLEIFTETVYTFDKKPLSLKDIEITENPDIPMRTLGINPVHLERRSPGLGNKRYCYRLRLRQMDEGWGINNHSFFRVLPPSKYHDAHPDWYDPQVKTLCLTNEEMIAEYIENMKKIVEDTPNDSLYMFGMEDVLEQCHCPKCKAIIDKYGYPALMLIFADKMIKKLNAWLKEKHPERKVYFFTFAYHWTIAPPVIKQADGSYKLTVEGLKLEDNFGVLIAPLLTSANYPMEDERAFVSLDTVYHNDVNIKLKDVFDGWRAVVKHIAVWTYNHNFYDYMVPCPMWQALEQNIRYFYKSNAIHVFIEGGCTVGSNFSEMKIYVCSNLMWNTSLTRDDLIKKFTGVFYKGAEKEISGYFNYIHEHAEWLLENLNRPMLYVHFDDDPCVRWLDARFWSKDVLFKCLEYFDNALKKDLSDEVRQRVLVESIPAKFTLLELYVKELDKDYALSLIDELLEITGKNKSLEIASDEQPKTFVAYAEKWKNMIN